MSKTKEGYVPNRLIGVEKKRWKDIKNSPSEYKEYRKAIVLKHLYGLQWATYLKMKEDQNNSCAICGHVATDKGKDVLHVDHCHETGKIRGLLCNKCNKAVGLLCDKTHLLSSAILYLTNARGQTLVYE